MKVRKIKIAGFRGFNVGQEISIDKRLTIIYGPNSYGKTSISEALEWLLFGITSKVEVSASGKKEFKGTYRNIHFPPTSTPYVEIVLEQGDKEITVRGELRKDDSITRFYNGEPVDSWPWEIPELRYYSPFILQHALQDLLLTSPSDRYSRFSKLLGTQILDDFQDIFNSLATSYNPPGEAQTFLAATDKLLSELKDDTFANFLKAIRGKNLPIAIDYLNELAVENLGEDGTEALDENGNISPEILERLIANRKEEVSAVFGKDIVLQGISEREQTDIDTAQNSIAAFISQELIDQYLEYAKLKAHAEYKKQADFFEVGLQIVEESPDECPFCGTELTDDISAHIAKKHKGVNAQIVTFTDLDSKKTKFLKDLKAFRQAIETYFSLILGKTANLAEINNKEDKEKISAIFGEEDLPAYKELLEIIETLCATRDVFIQKKELVQQAIQAIEDSFVKYHQSTEHITLLGETVVAVISAGQELGQNISSNSTLVSQIDEKFGERLNVLAGTQNLALIITLLEQFGDIRKYVLIKQAIDSMKDLRANVTQYISDKTRAIVEYQLTDEVMHWYEQIKTAGDPDVHFSGFSLGGRKDRHEISVLATSYGQELVSAVSSLSESKLNALGLSIKISNNVKDGIPFRFLIIDDPVQSLDGDHATQISTIIRKLVEEYDKQIILLSHNETWLEQLIKGNQSLNGMYYEMTGFDVAGPQISVEEWRAWRRRLDDVKAICSNTSAKQVQLQQAEEEIRLAICDIASRVYNKKTSKIKPSHDLNETKVRSMLLESGIESGLVDRISQTFTTTDDSHHTGEKYVANRERIMQYHSWAHELAQQLK